MLCCTPLPLCLHSHRAPSLLHTSGSASAPAPSSSLLLLPSAAAALLGPAPERPRFSAGPDDEAVLPLLLALAPPARPRFFLGGLAAGLGPMSAGGKPSSMVIQL